MQRLMEIFAACLRAAAARLRLSHWLCIAALRLLLPRLQNIHRGRT